MKSEPRKIRPGELEIRIRRDGTAYFLAADEAMMRVIDNIKLPDFSGAGDPERPPENECDAPRCCGRDKH